MEIDDFAQRLQRKLKKKKKTISAYLIWVVNDRGTTFSRKWYLTYDQKNAKSMEWICDDDDGDSGGEEEDCGGEGALN